MELRGGYELYDTLGLVLPEVPIPPVMLVRRGWEGGVDTVEGAWGNSYLVRKTAGGVGSGGTPTEPGSTI